MLPPLMGHGSTIFHCGKKLPTPVIRALHLAAYEEPVYTNLFMTLARMLDASPISWDEVPR